MTVRSSISRRDQSTGPPRVGLFGNLGSQNIGNDGSMESMLRYLKTEHPDAIVDAMCAGPERLKAEYGIESTLPLRPWQLPYSMFLLCASGKLFRTKVALISVGADIIDKRATRWLSNSAARLAFYRSYRDTYSREAMRQRGLDVTRDHVYPDLVFGLPTPDTDVSDPLTVGVGVMAYYGSNDDRPQANAIYASYVANIKCFVRWLVDNDRGIRLLVGDANGSDDSVVQEILADLRTRRPNLPPGQVVAARVSSIAEVMQEMAQVGTVVATRYHNVLCALKLSKPTVSLGYSAKHRALMADMGLPEFCQSANSFDVNLLIKQFTELESRSPELRQVMAERNLVNERHLGQQFAALSALLFPAGERLQAS